MHQTPTLSISTPRVRNIIPKILNYRNMQVTVSTVGLVPEIHRLRGACRAQLAVSLHAASNEVRALLQSSFVCRLSCSVASRQANTGVVSTRPAWHLSVWECRC